MVSNHYNWKIFNSAMIVAGFSFLAKIVSALKDLIVAASLGTGESVDAFLLGALLPLLSVSVLAAPYGLALVPAITRLVISDSRRRACLFFERSLVYAILPLGLMALAGTIFSSQIAAFLVPQSGTLMIRTASALQLLSSLVLLSGISQLLIMALGAFEIFALPAISQTFSPLLIVVSLFFLPEQYQQDSLAIGAVAGNGLQLAFLLGLYGAVRFRSRGVVPALARDQNEFQAQNRSVFSQWIPLFISALLMSSTDIIDQVMAAYLGPGEVATFSFGMKVPALLISVLAGSLTSAAFPYLSQMIERSEHELLRQTLFTYTRLILLASGILVAGVMLLSLPVVRLLFERGAFTSQDSINVAFVQQMAVLQLPFYLLNGLYMRVIMARRAGRWLSLVTIGSVFLNVSLNLLFSQWIGVAGIALSTSCVYLWSTLALGYLLMRQKMSA